MLRKTMEIKKHPDFNMGDGCIVLEKKTKFSNEDAAKGYGSYETF